MQMNSFTAVIIMSEGAEFSFGLAAKCSTMELCYFMLTVIPGCVSQVVRHKN